MCLKSRTKHKHMKEIELTRGYKALVDDEDFERVKVFKWKSLISKRKHRQDVVYACRNQRKVNGAHWTDQVCIYMHRFILGCPGHVDHKDGDGLNNQRDNLRECTRSQNSANQKKQKGSSRYKGVSWHAGGKKWQVHIKTPQKNMYLGLFADEADAATVYNFAALEHFGEFAVFNTPEVQA